MTFGDTSIVNFSMAERKLRLKISSSSKTCIEFLYKTRVTTEALCFLRQGGMAIMPGKVPTSSAEETSEKWTIEDKRVVKADEPTNSWKLN